MFMPWHYEDGVELSAHHLAKLVDDAKWTPDRVMGMMGPETDVTVTVKPDDFAMSPDMVEPVDHCWICLNGRDCVFESDGVDNLPDGLQYAINFLDEFDGDDVKERAFARYARILGWDVHKVSLQDGPASRYWIPFMFIIPAGRDIAEYTEIWDLYLQHEVYRVTVECDGEVYDDFTDVWGDKSAEAEVSEILKELLDHTSQQIRYAKIHAS